MNEELPEQSSVTTYTYYFSDRSTDITTCTGPASTPGWLAAMEPVQEPPFVFEHDTQKGIFRLTWADGEVEVFRDRPARHLVVAPDPETGEMKPVVRRGRPEYLYLCREDREIV